MDILEYSPKVEYNLVLNKDNNMNEKYISQSESRIKCIIFHILNVFS